MKILLGILFAISTSCLVMAETIPGEVQTVADTFKLGNFVRSHAGWAPSGSTSAERFYYFARGRVATLSGHVHGGPDAKGVTFFPSDVTLPAYIINATVQQKLGAYLGYEAQPVEYWKLTIHFENGDISLNYRPKHDDINEVLVGMELGDMFVPGTLLFEAMHKNLGRFLRESDGILYFEHGSI